MEQFKLPDGILPQQILNKLNAMVPGTLMQALGISFTHVSDGLLEATMSVGPATLQPMGLLHGGASLALIETLGSAGAYLYLNPQTHHAVGIEVNANHIKGVRAGLVTGRATPLHIGQTTQVWDVKIWGAEQQLVSVGRVTNAIVDAR